MSSKLEQALARLEDAVEQLEHAPPASSASPDDAKHDDAVKAEITAIRGLVHDAMALLAAEQNGKGEAS